MGASQPLTIKGYRDGPVSNTFVTHDTATRQLAVFLPGMGYTCDMPLFYSAENLFVDAGVDLLRVEYAYGRRPEFQALTHTEQMRWLFTDATAAYDAGLARRTYDSVTLVGKSLGTLAMGIC